MTQGENIADSGGLKQAYRVFIFTTIDVHLHIAVLFDLEKNKKGESPCGCWYRQNDVYWASKFVFNSHHVVGGRRDENLFTIIIFPSSFHSSLSLF